MYVPKLVITGIGAVTPIGLDVEEYWQALISGVCGVGEITRFDASGLKVRIAAEVKGFNPRDFMPKTLVRTMPHFMQYAFAASDEALRDSGLDVKEEATRTGIVMGSAMGGLSTIAQTQHESDEGQRTGPRFVSTVTVNTSAAQIAIAHDIRGPSLTLGTACSSGGDAIMSAAMLIMSGEADAVLAVGADSVICPIVVSSLAAAKALSRNNAHPEHACRPFDVNRDGFVIGEGGGAVLIETENHALKRGAGIYAVLAGWGNTSDAYHITAPRPDGGGAAQCMATALKRSGLKPEDIGYINCHGTGTVIGDKAETCAIKAVFGNNIPAVSSTKSMTGHLMGAGGITEAIACIMALREGILPQTLNLETPDPECSLNHILHAPFQKKVKAVMSNSLGFGGQNSSLVFTR